ncbi:MAG: hypothetical protein VKJ44_06805 [Synechococcus sp.]|nr:hypothetical protein [Synechococcus sp.]
MDWKRFDDARALLQARRTQAAISLLRELRRSCLHPAVAPLLAEALIEAGDPEAAEQVLAEDCQIGIADHWSWLARAVGAARRGHADQASRHRAQAYELLGWPGCVARNYRFEQDEVSQLLPRWCRVFALLLPSGPLQVLSVQGAAGGFALWALERLARRGGQLSTIGGFERVFVENLARCDRTALAAPPAALTSLPALASGELAPAGEGEPSGAAPPEPEPAAAGGRSGAGEPLWDVIHLGPGCGPAQAWQQCLRPRLRPEGVMLAHDPDCLTGAERILPGVLVARPAAARAQPRSS